ncbi:MAG: CinA family protein [Candidatus Omnitrophica bacterium]|nr:CinA family protein [Candidatus Omnitrophota bacterium]
MKEIFEKDIFNKTGTYTILKELGDILKEKKIHLVIAESCTGGLIGHLITEIPGSSEYFNGSFVVYTNILKKRILKVPRTLLRKYSAVSREVAMAMAKGAKKIGKADVSIAVTGIAGPSSGYEGKQIGLVYVAICLVKNHIRIKEFSFSGDRSAIKMKAALAAMDFLLKEIQT